MSRIATAQTPSRAVPTTGDQSQRSLETDKPGTSSSRPMRRLCGILIRKERWSLSWGGRLLVLSLIALGALAVIPNIFPFLAVTHRVDSNILVVEGWVHKYAISVAATEFKNGPYERIFATGGPVEGLGGYVNDYQTSASVGADLLRKVGVPNESLEMVPSRVLGRDRTYSSAVALRDWFHDHNMTVHNMNVLTEDCHARRSRLLYEKAFGSQVSIGIIAVSSPDYDAKHWWRYSDGVREVIGESIAYIYARVLFHPPGGSQDKKPMKTVQSETRR
jgi:hypothetical protein